jgi:hypothetical protein
LIIFRAFREMLFSIRGAPDKETRLFAIGIFAAFIGIFVQNLTITNLIEHYWATLGIGIALSQVVKSHAVKKQVKQISDCA